MVSRQATPHQTLNTYEVIPMSLLWKHISRYVTRTTRTPAARNNNARLKVRLVVEGLEARELMTVSGLDQLYVQPAVDLQAINPALAVVGLTPAQVRHAY